jgi:hypothetical protein
MAAAATPVNPMPPPLRLSTFVVPRPIVAARNPSQVIAGKQPPKGKKTSAATDAKRQSGATTGAKGKKQNAIVVGRGMPNPGQEEELPHRSSHRRRPQKKSCLHRLSCCQHTTCLAKCHNGTTV